MTTLNIAVGIPTIGRAAILCHTLAELGRQVRPPQQVIVCGTKSEDVQGAATALRDGVILLAGAGLPRQRNAVIANCGDADILVFFDDDFLPDPGYLAAVDRHMTAFPRTVMVTGTVVADGISGPGLSAAEGLSLLGRSKASGSGARPTFAAYGCNMAIRLAPLRQHALRFDERLPLYGWQEDVDLSRQLAVFGDIMQIDDARGVHLGAKVGRGPGVRLGYSQVANPLYLSSKRRGYPLRRAIGHIAGNMAMNVMRAAWSEPYVDRRGRLRGNALALRDLVAGQLLPERILDL